MRRISINHFTYPQERRVKKYRYILNFCEYKTQRKTTNMLLTLKAANQTIIKQVVTPRELKY